MKYVFLRIRNLPCDKILKWNYQNITFQHCQHLPFATCKNWGFRSSPAQTPHWGWLPFLIYTQLHILSTTCFIGHFFQHFLLGKTVFPHLLLQKLLQREPALKTPRWFCSVSRQPRWCHYLGFGKAAWDPSQLAPLHWHLPLRSLASTTTAKRRSCSGCNTLWENPNYLTTSLSSSQWKVN